MNRLFNRLVINCRDNFEMFVHNIIMGHGNSISFTKDLSFKYLSDDKLLSLTPIRLYIEDIDDNSIYLVYKVDNEEYEEELGSLSLDAIIKLCKILIEELS